MAKKRKKIPTAIKDYVRFRQNDRCATCLNFGQHFHHIDPVSLSGMNRNNNIILLCIECHKLLHLADPETCMKIFEYGYYINTGKMPDNPYSLVTAQEVLDMIRECY